MVSFTVHIALISWIPIVFVIFSVMPATRAVIVSFLAAWMFLPMYGYDLPGIPDYTKTSATTYAVLLAMFLFDSRRLAALRPRLLDVPMVVWCTVPLVSSMTAGYGLYDGLSGLLNKWVAWGFPYLIGRVYLTDLKAMRDLALGLFIGGLVYMPLCLFEIRMSPQLHAMVYGFHQHDFAQTHRGGGYRPTVFMQHGLAVGMFMCTAALAGFWLWRTKAVRVLWGAPMGLLVLGVLGTAVLCHSSGAIALMILGMGVLIATRMFRTSLFVRVLIMLPIVYLVARTVGGWSGQEFIDVAEGISADRGGSLRVRLASETGLWKAVQPNLFFGMARFIFMSQDVEEGSSRIIPDGMWLIALGSNGLVGLVSFVSCLLWPAWAFLKKAPGRIWGHPQAAPAAVLTMVVVLYMCDNLFNAMPNPLFVVATGGLTTLATAAAARKSVRPARRIGAVGPVATAAAPPVARLGV